jgi:hypothetical protein
MACGARDAGGGSGWAGAAPAVVGRGEAPERALWVPLDLLEESRLPFTQHAQQRVVLDSGHLGRGSATTAILLSWRLFHRLAEDTPPPTIARSHDP